MLVLLGAMAALHTHVDTQAQSRNALPSQTYTLAFSQIAIGGGTGRSAAYSVEDVVALGAGGGEKQVSANYAILNPLDFEPLANNGLAIGQGTTMRLDWSSVAQPADVVGFNVYRSAAGGAGDYEKVNSSLVAATTYEDAGLSNGTYYYIVYYHDSRDETGPLTAPFFGIIYVEDASLWMLY